MIRRDELVRISLTEPQSLKSLTLRDWDLLLRQGRGASVLGRLHALLEDYGLLENVPAPARHYLEGARLVASNQERAISWEVYCIERGLQHLETDFVILKGAAYIFSRLP